MADFDPLAVLGAFGQSGGLSDDLKQQINAAAQQAGATAGTAAGQNVVSAMQAALPGMVATAVTSAAAAAQQQMPGLATAAVTAAESAAQATALPYARALGQEAGAGALDAIQNGIDRTTFTIAAAGGGALLLITMAAVYRAGRASR